MTDREKLIKLLDEFGVEYLTVFTDIYCREDSKKVVGYTGFYTAFSFTEEGEFISIGAYE